MQSSQFRSPSTTCDDLVKERDIAKATDLDALEIALEDTDGRHGDLCKHLVQSADATTRKKHEMQANITSILRFHEAMEDDMAALRDENANLWEVIRSRLGDDVEKRKGVKVVKRKVQPSRVAEQKALRADLPKTVPADTVPSQSETVPQPEIPQLSRCLTEKERIVGEGKIMMDMVLAGEKIDVVTNPFT